jgi:hypothetical protein
LICVLDHETLNLITQSVDLITQLGLLVGQDRSGDDGTGNTAGATEGNLAGNEHIRNVLNRKNTERLATRNMQATTGSDAK